MSKKVSIKVFKCFVAAIVMAFIADANANVFQKSRTSGVSNTQKNSARRKRRPRPATTTTSQDPAAKTGTGEPKATQVGAELNKKGEEGAQAKDPTRGAESNQADPKSVPTP